MKSETLTCMKITDEPGDGIHYEFLITEGYKPEYLLIARGSKGREFRSYDYAIDQISLFFKENSKLKEVILYNDYIDIANTAIHNHYIGYICDHSNCNAWTAIAAVRVAYKYLEGIDG